MKYADIKTKEELRNRIIDGELSIGCYWQNVRLFVTKKRESKDQIKTTIKYSPGYGGTAEMIRYI